MHRNDGDFVEFTAERELESRKDMLRLFQIPFPKVGEDKCDHFGKSHKELGIKGASIGGNANISPPNLLMAVTGNADFGMNQCFLRFFA